MEKLWMELEEASVKQRQQLYDAVLAAELEVVYRRNHLNDGRLCGPCKKMLQ